MKIGVKFCGGCNPRYDRAGIIEKLKKDFEQVEVYYLSSEGEPPDLTLEINGCNSNCITGKAVQGKFGVVSVAAVEDYDKIVQKLEEALMKK